VKRRPDIFDILSQIKVFLDSCFGGQSPLYLLNF